jgi:peptidyl-prolyl cis-trans isomerase D
MAKTTPTEEPRKKKSGASMAVWGLLALCMVGLGGFGVTNFGGGVTSIGKVGDREIDVNEYARALKQEIDALSAQFGQPLTLTQAQAFGVDRKVLQTLISRAALNNEAARVGISAGDATVASQIAGMTAFQGTPGTFDRETYRQALQRNNLTEAQFESGLREDVARSLLQGAVVGGFAAPAPLTDTLYAFIGERRGFSLLQLTADDLATPIATPTDAELQALYQEKIDQFTTPEAKRITYVALLPEDLAPSMQVDEAALKKLYEDRISEYMVPEHRLVERLVYPTEDDAKAAKARLDAGETFETLVADRGLTLNDIDLGDVSKADLGAAGDAVFAMTEPGVVGPLMSDLGPALFRMNGILAAQETTFDEARTDLAAEMQTDAARRAISDQVETVDDLLAGGATLEDVAKETKAKLGTIDYVSGGTDNSGIAGYPDFRAAADKVADGDFPEGIVLSDGGLVALRLDAVVPPAPIPFEDARDKVAAVWTADALAKALAARADEVKVAVDGGASLGAYGIVSVTREIARDGTIPGAPAGMMQTLFKMAPGEVQVVTGPDYTAVLQLNDVMPAPTEGPDADALKEAIAVQAEQAIAQDAFTLFTTALSAEAGITIDQGAINAVHARFN